MFRFVEQGKNTVLFSGPDKYPVDVYDLNNANSVFGKLETERQANAHMYLLVSSQWITALDKQLRSAVRDHPRLLAHLKVFG